jgi:DeoR/GlpR family transcriptional regulator of sugar metabolism
VHTPEKEIALSLGVSRKRLAKMMYLIENLHSGNTLDIERAAEKFGVIPKSIKRDLLLLEKKGWVISSGTTSNRIYQLSQQATEQLINLKN